MKQYKGYDAQVVYDADAGILHGSVPNIRGAITFEAWSVDELEREFHASVDEYLEFCERNGVEPAKPFSGNFVLRAGPDLHGRIAQAAARSGASLNAWVVQQLDAAVASTSGPEDATEPGSSKRPGRRPKGIGVYRPAEEAKAAAKKSAAKKVPAPKAVAKAVASRAAAGQAINRSTARRGKAS